MGRRSAYDTTSSQFGASSHTVYASRYLWNDVNILIATLAGATAGHGVFGTLTAEPGELSQRGVRGPYWRPLGRDPLLEQRLLADMIRRSLAMEPTQ